MSFETLIIQGLASAFFNLVEDNTNTLTSTLVKEAIKHNLDEEEREMLDRVIRNTGNRL